MTTPQPVNGLPSRPGIWKIISEYPIELIGGTPFIYNFSPSKGHFWVQVTKDLGPFQWVREFRDGDPRIRPAKPAPPLPDAEHRHPDGCPKDGLWVYRCSRGELEFRLVRQRQFTLSLHGECPADIHREKHSSFVKCVGQPSDFAPAEPQSPALEPCPWCGSEPLPIDENACGEYVLCSNEKCRSVGPSEDPDGAKWNRVARAVREETP